MARPSTDYARRSPDAAVLYQVVRDHLETFLAQAASLRDGEGVPRFVEHAFRQFLRCGWLAGGFARFQCATCGCERLVAFYTKKDVPPAHVWEQLNQTALPRLWLPRRDQIFQVESIPTLGSGKVDLRGLRQQPLQVGLA